VPSTGGRGGEKGGGEMKPTIVPAVYNSGWGENKLVEKSVSCSPKTSLTLPDEIDLNKKESNMSDSELKEIVALKRNAEKAYEALDAKVKSIFDRDGETIASFEEVSPDDDKAWTRVSLTDNVKKLKEEGSCFHSTAFKAIGIKVERLKNQPK